MYFGDDKTAGAVQKILDGEQARAEETCREEGRRSRDAEVERLRLALRRIVAEAEKGRAHGSPETACVVIRHIALDALK